MEQDKIAVTGKLILCKPNLDKIFLLKSNVLYVVLKKVLNEIYIGADRADYTRDLYFKEIACGTLHDIESGVKEPIIVKEKPIAIYSAELNGEELILSTFETQQSLPENSLLSKLEACDEALRLSYQSGFLTNELEDKVKRNNLTIFHQGKEIPSFEESKEQLNQKSKALMNKERSKLIENDYLIYYLSIQEDIIIR